MPGEIERQGDAAARCDSRLGPRTEAGLITPVAMDEEDSRTGTARGVRIEPEDLTGERVPAGLDGDLLVDRLRGLSE